MAAEVDNEIMLISNVYVCERVSSFIEICAIFAFAIDLVGKRERFWKRVNYRSTYNILWVKSKRWRVGRVRKIEYDKNEDELESIGKTKHIAGAK